MNSLLLSHDRINAISKIVPINNYLEIGISSGNTFFKVDAPFKVGVDPHFKFDYRQHLTSNCLLYPTTSDAFFQDQAHNNLPAFDLIFLDGLHTFEQTLRDFIFSLKFSHKKTIWLLDDTVPLGLLASLKNYKITKICRTLCGIKNTGAWMGDVFKVIFTIHDFFPQFSYATFPFHGQTIVWQESRDEFCPTWNSLSKISGLNYYDFLHYKSTHFNIIDAEQILRTITTSLVFSKGEINDY